MREERVEDRHERNDSDFDPDLCEYAEDRDRSINKWTKRNVDDANQIANDNVIQAKLETVKKLDNLMTIRKEVCRNIQYKRLAKVKDSLTNTDVLKYRSENASIRNADNLDQIRRAIAVSMLARADAQQASIDYRACLGDKEEAKIRDKKRRDKRVESILDNLRLFTVGAEVPQKETFSWETKLREEHNEVFRQHDLNRNRRGVFSLRHLLIIYRIAMLKRPCGDSLGRWQ